MYNTNEMVYLMSLLTALAASAGLVAATMSGSNTTPTTVIITLSETYTVTPTIYHHLEDRQGKYMRMPEVPNLAHATLVPPSGVDSAVSAPSAPGWTPEALVSAASTESDSNNEHKNLEDQAKKSGARLGIILGCILAALLGFSLFFSCVFFACKKRSRAKKASKYANLRDSDIELAGSRNPIRVVAPLVRAVAPRAPLPVARQGTYRPTVRNTQPIHYPQGESDMYQTNRYPKGVNPYKYNPHPT